ncbi:dihydrodipicolinate synthase family protein [Brucella sp. BE17]|uniref:dihydrodipicolinate synthase family protein n=1 Tax=Brucella sp. BE17 TaxID=3142977 RepID=UPI0031BBC650
MSIDFFQGLSAFPLTPIDVSGNVDAAILTRFLDRIQMAGADSVGLLGSTGSYAYLSRSQRQQAVQIAVHAVGGKTPLIVGVGALRADEAVILARDAEEAGADALLLAPVSYTPLTDEEVYQHFRTVAEATSLPLCIYNNPGTTRFIFAHELIVRLAKLKNIKAIKMPLPANDAFKVELSKLRSETKEDFSIGYSGDWGAADALLAGCDCWYSVIAGLLPVPALSLARAAQAANRAEAERINLAFQPLWELFKRFGSFRVMYVIADLLGLAQIEPPRPILPLAPPVRAKVEQALESLDSLELSRE